MVAYCKPPAAALALIFERDGEPTVRIEASPDKALTRAVAFLLAHQSLRAGDRLTVTAAD